MANASDSQPVDVNAITTSKPVLSAPVRDLEPAPPGATSTNDELTRVNPLAATPDQDGAVVVPIGCAP